jgi:hypothetical protein
MAAALSMAVAIFHFGSALGGGECITFQARTAPAQWTVMIYMNGKNELESGARYNFAQIAQVGSTDDVNFIAEVGLLSWEHTYRIRVTQNSTLGATGPAPSDGVVDLGKVDMGSQPTLARFVAAAKRDYPASHYLLIVWDHGAGWRFTRGRFVPIGSSPSSEPPTAKTAPIPRNLQNSATTHQSNPRSISRDDEFCTRLFNSDMQQTLEADPVDIIGFDACLMSMVETAHALRLGAHWMVGSEEEIPPYGWKYDDWCQMLTQNPSLRPRQLCRIIGDTYLAAYSNQGQNPYPVDEAITFSVVDLARVRDGRLVGAITRFADRLLEIIDGDALGVIKAARANCAEYAPDETRPGGWFRYQHIDLVRFCEQIVEQDRGNDPHLERLAEAVIRQVHRAVAMRWCGKLRCDGDPCGQRFGSHGLAIYFPASKRIFQSDLEDPKIGRGYEIDNLDHPVEFVRDRSIHWASFLQFFVSRVPK